MDFHMREM
jgi:protein transport protein SEC23